MVGRQGEVAMKNAGWAVAGILGVGVAGAIIYMRRMAKDTEQATETLEEFQRETQPLIEQSTKVMEDIAPVAESISETHAEAKGAYASVAETFGLQSQEGGWTWNDLWS